MSVLVAGNLVLDQLLWPVEKIRWDATVWVEKLVRSIGGNGANTSYTLAKLGMPVMLEGAVGEDAEAEEILRMLREAGVDVGRVGRVQEPTPATVALVKKTGSRAFIHRPGASRVSLQEPIDMPAAKHFHVANPFGVVAMRKMAPVNLERAKAAGMTTSLDAGWDSRGEWGAVAMPCCPHLDVMFLNAEEGRLITGKRSAKESVKALHEAGVKYVVLKQGKKGAMLSGPGFTASVPGYQVEAVDSTGAGDVFAGAFLAAWLKGQSMTEAAQFANAAAAMSVMQVGSVAGVQGFRETFIWMRAQAAVPSS